ncbi:unnamed protein product, partial [Pylaiella littoralis]
EYVTCDRNVWSDKDTCKVTLSMLLASKDKPHGCQLCLCDVGGYPSIGIPTERRTTVATPCGRTTTASSHTAQEPGVTT